jgi:ABC-type nitrate/sulfonate/bicarbonate transport system permease component
MHSQPAPQRTSIVIKVGLPRSMPYFFGSLKVAITLAFVGTTVSEMTATNKGIRYLLISAGVDAEVSRSRSKGKLKACGYTTNLM